MEHEYWRTRWSEGRTGWHEAEGSPALRAHLSALELGPGTRVLVPLAGKSHDLALLASTGATVVGVELVEAAATAFFAEHGLSAVRAIEHGRVVLRAGSIEIICGDFLREEPATLGVFDSIVDRAAMVALPPAMRVPYAETVRRLARSSARMLVVTFEHDAGGDEPPFSLGSDDLASSYPSATIEPLEARDLYDAHGTLAARGATFAREGAFLLRLP